MQGETPPREASPPRHQYFAVDFVAFTYGLEPYLDDYMKLGWELIRPVYERSGHMSWILGWRCGCPVVKPQRSLNAD